MTEDNPTYLPTPEQVEEANRQYSVAQQFLAIHPEYKGRAEDAEALLSWMEARDMDMTLEGLELAYKSIYEGPVEATQLAMQISVPEQFWKGSTGISGPNTHGHSSTEVTTNISDADWWTKGWVALPPSWATNKTKPEPEPEPEKPVASMPTTWYSDVVQIQTGRRIKE